MPKLWDHIVVTPKKIKNKINNMLMNGKMIKKIVPTRSKNKLLAIIKRA